MIAIFVVAALAALALMYVMGPMFRSGAGRRSEEAGKPTQAVARKDVALGALLDLEEERDLGKLSSEDFDRLRVAYETEALAALRELDAEVTLEDDLEAEVAALREQMTCPSCGSLRRPGEACARCGD